MPRVDQTLNTSHSPLSLTQPSRRVSLASCVTDASAFHYFSTSINLKPDFPSSYMYLAITLNRLDDFDNACQAYEKAIEMEEDHLFHLNYAITLLANDETLRAKKHFGLFERLFNKLDDEAKNADPEVLEQKAALAAALRTGALPPSGASTEPRYPQPPSAPSESRGSSRRAPANGSHPASYYDAPSAAEDDEVQPEGEEPESPELR